MTLDNDNGDYRTGDHLPNQTSNNNNTNNII